MDIFANLTNLINSQESAYVAGLIAAFTPCIIAITPVLLYRFGFVTSNLPDKRHTNVSRSVVEIAQFLAGFFITFLLTGLVLNQLSSSVYVNVTRLSIGFALTLIGILQLFNFFDINIAHRYSHPLALGLITPLVVSFSPCVLPYFSTLFAGNEVGYILPRFILFGAGVLTPAIAISLLGGVALSAMRKSSRFIARIQSFSPWLIILSGIYLSNQILEINKLDIGILSIINLGLIVWMSYRVFRISDYNTVTNWRNIAVVIMIWLLSMIYLLGIAPDAQPLSNAEFIWACTTKSSCDICGITTVITALNAFALGIFVIRSRKPGQKVNWKF